MTAPFTTDQLLTLAARYNAYIEPLQILIYIPTLLIFVLLWRGTKQDTSRGVLLLLAAEWAAVGALFYLHVVASEHWFGYLPGIFFVGTGLFYAVSASRSFPPHFRWKGGDNPTLLSLTVTVVGIIGYPMLSWLAERSYPGVVTYGMMPGAVVMLTMGVAIAARPGPRLWLMIPPLAYVLVTPLFLAWWRLWEDLVLLPCGVIAVLAWLLWRGKNTATPTKDTIRFDF